MLLRDFCVQECIKSLVVRLYKKSNPVNVRMLVYLKIISILAMVAFFMFLLSRMESFEIVLIINNQLNK